MSGMTDPWGIEQPPAEIGKVAPLPPRLARLAEVQATGIALTAEDPYAQESPGAHELPEVRRLTRDGWRPLHSAPLHCLLPAAWPGSCAPGFRTVCRAPGWARAQTPTSAPSRPSRTTTS